MFRKNKNSNKKIIRYLHMAGGTKITPQKACETILRTNANKKKTYPINKTN